MKDEILNYVTMENILDKYGIEHRNSMFSCPFHGIDRKPSAKAYRNNFCCFACGKNRDIIGFVEEYFNLSFKEAMQKINMDFNLGLENDKVDYEKLNQIKSIQNEKKKKKQQLTDKYCELCSIKDGYETVKEYCSKKINIKNWETYQHVIAYLDTQIYKVNEEIKDIDNKLSSRT